MKNEHGSIAIETLLGLIALLLFLTFFAVWITVSAVQLRVHHALTQTAKEISFYAHALEMAGAVDVLRALDKQAAPTRREIDGSIANVFGIWNSVGDARGSIENTLNTQSLGELESNVNSLKQQMGTTADTIVGNSQNIMNTMEGWAENPMDFFKGLMWIGIQEVSYTAMNYLMGYTVVPLLFWRYMGIDIIENDRWHSRIHGRYYFESAPVQEDTVSFVWWPDSLGEWAHGLGSGGIAGGALRPNGVQFLTGPNADTIIIGVRYDIDMGRYLRHIRNDLPVVQQVQARAWVGDGRRWQALPSSNN